MSTHACTTDLRLALVFWNTTTKTSGIAISVPTYLQITSFHFFVKLTHLHGHEVATPDCQRCIITKAHNRKKIQMKSIWLHCLLFHDHNTESLWFQELTPQWSPLPPRKSALVPVLSHIHNRQSHYHFIIWTLDTECISVPVLSPCSTSASGCLFIRQSSLNRSASVYL